INLLFGTGLPVEKADKPARFGPYRRIDLGISKQLLDGQGKFAQTNKFWANFKSIWLSLEAFNLIDIKNEVSYTYVTDIRGQQYGVPNYLTGRRFNLKLMIKF
ncbi:MAG: TonB-dependent receptor, partial [Bacteroidales bacterium]|nr:TonB-dependent receptor [Bacteroidales bacterium]